MILVIKLECFFLISLLALYAIKEVRWLSVDGHSGDGHYVVCHLRRIAIRIDSYVASCLRCIVCDSPVQMSLRSHCYKSLV